jgi:hypothetical protein
MAHFEQMPAACNNVPGPNAFAPIERDRHVERDPVHPGGKSHPLVERAKRSPELDDDFLRQVVPVAHQRLKPLLYRPLLF